MVHVTILTGDSQMRNIRPRPLMTPTSAIDYLE